MSYQKEKNRLKLQLKQAELEKFRLMDSGSHIELCNVEQKIRLISRQLVRLDAVHAMNPLLFEERNYRFEL